MPGEFIAQLAGPLLAAILVATLVERILEYTLAPILSAAGANDEAEVFLYTYRVAILRLVSIAMGLVLVGVLFSGLDFVGAVFDSVGVTSNIPHVTDWMSGFLLGFGPGFVHDVIRQFQPSN